MKILVTGAAGYIGSILTEELIKEGNSVIALDNLQQGHREVIPPQAEFIQADLAEREKLDEICGDSHIDAVMHLAADSIVAQSVTDPQRFFRNNVTCSLNLLGAMIKSNIDKLIFSSSAAVYGEPENTPIKESEPERPVNPYGETKLIFEKVLPWYHRTYGLNSISLRYFNAAGASRDLGEDHDPETHLIPNTLKVALGQAKYVPVFGNDYPTPDGSCIRDYIHVLDIARAHILALKKLEKNAICRIYNLGNNRGFSVLEVIETARKITKAPIPMEIQPRRQGDPAMLVANSELAKAELGWQPKLSSLETIIQSAWQWQQQHPHGYGGRHGQ